MSLNPAALNHRICPRGLSSTRPAHTNTLTLCKTYSGFCRPVFKPSYIKARWKNSVNIPAGDKPRKAPCTRSVFLLFSSSPPPPPPPLLPHLPTSDSPQWAMFRPTALRFQTLSCLSRELTGLQATKYDVNKLDRGRFFTSASDLKQGERGAHTAARCLHIPGSSERLRGGRNRRAAVLKDQSVKSEGLRLVGMRCNNKNPQICFFFIFLIQQ